MTSSTAGACSALASPTIYRPAAHNITANPIICQIPEDESRVLTATRTPSSATTTANTCTTRPTPRNGNRVLRSPNTLTVLCGNTLTNSTSAMDPSSTGSPRACQTADAVLHLLLLPL